MRRVYVACFAATLVACPKKDPPKTLEEAAAPDDGVMTFERDEDAFDEVLKENPAVLAIGEAHAQRGATAASSTKRFTEELLPLLAGRTSDLLVELMMPPKGCAKQTETMRSVQKPVVTQQAETNQNEYVAMGEAARKLGIAPDLLRPSCEDLASINDAGDDAIERSLETIARLTTTQAKAMIARRGTKMVVTYGGALHNDVAPPPARAQWSYGRALAAEVPTHYIELDLYVPDFITDEENWRNQPWYARWIAHKSSPKPLLIELAPKNYVLILSKR